MDEEQARRILEQAHRAGLVDAALARRALEVMRVAPPGGRHQALARLGLPPQVAAALGGGPPTPDPTPWPGARPTPNPTPHPSGLSSTVRLPGADRVAPGGRLGPFTIEGELGRGGMGVVLKARHDDGRPAAVKLLLEAGAASGAARFQREVQALAALDHPNIVKLLGVSPEGLLPLWLAMAFVEGEDLDKRLARGPLPPDEAARLLAEVALGVAHAHRRGVIHRDLKPSNILLRAAGSTEVGRALASEASTARAIVTDFGLAKGQDAERLTRTGSMVGTLAYMAPEQVSGRADVAAPADVWALGAILYRALTGREPFVGDSAMSLAAAICEGGPVAPRKLARDVPADLEALALSCLVKDPAARPTATQVAAALRDRRQPVTGRPGPRALVLAGLVGAALAGVGVVLVRRGPAPGPGPTAATVTPPPPPAEPPAGPWPAAPAGWRRVWSAAQGPPAAPAEPALWRAPDEAAPVDLVRQGAPGALAAACAGEATPLGAGRVRVRHAEPARTLGVEVPNPGFFTSHGDPAMAVVEPTGPGSARVLAANDSSGVVLRAGEGRWAGARVAVDVRLLEHVDYDNVALDVGVSEAPGAPLQHRLTVTGRSATLGFSAAAGTSGNVPFRLGERSVRLSLAPGADAGGRVLTDGLPVAGLDGLATARAPVGRVELLLQEVHLELRALDVEGLPVTVDRPALALPPLDRSDVVGCRAAIGVRFALPAPAAGPDEPPGGGPFVTLGAEVRLEVDGARVLLREGPRLLLVEELPRPPAAGWLWLARDGDRLRAVVVADEQRRELALLHPLPLRAGAPAYGSTGRSARFAGAEVWLGPDDPARSAFDSDPDAASADPRGRWRRGALGLARCSDPAWIDPALVGPEAEARRVAGARAAADDLDAAAAGLLDDAELRLDARARAVLARVQTTDDAGAAAAARALVDDAGLPRARALVDGLERERARPVLVERLVDGYTTIAHVALREAALRAALVLAPDAEARLAIGMAGNIRARLPRPDPATAAGKAALEGALALYEQARAKGADPRSFDAAEGDTYSDLGRHEEALARFEACTRHSPHYWWGWVRGGHCLLRLGKPVEALERTLGALSCAVTRGDIHQTLAELINLEEVQGAAPGLVAVALVALADAVAPTDEAGAAKLRTDATAMGQRASEADGRDGDLAAYALAALGRRAPARAGDRPTAVLARARAGERTDLEAARAADPLVDCLVRLDPTLAGRR